MRKQHKRMLKTQRTIHTKAYNQTREFYRSLHKGRDNVAMRKQKTGASLQTEGKAIGQKVRDRKTVNRDNRRPSTIKTRTREMTHKVKFMNVVHDKRGLQLMRTNTTRQEVNMVNSEDII